MRMTRHSLELTRRAWSCAITPSVKLVLLAYCLHASDQGLCWPSLARIATFTGLNQRTVQRHVRELEAAGALVCILHAKTSSKTYRINLDALEQSQRLNSQLQPNLPNMEEPHAFELGGWPQLSGDLPATEATATPTPQDWPVLDFAASQQPPANPVTVAQHRANLAKLRADFVTGAVHHHQAHQFKPCPIQQGQA